MKTKISPEYFFDLFLMELNETPALRKYYKFVESEKLFNFRKAYFIQRLKYIEKNISVNENVKIWDCGCGYGTTCLFLAINGIKTFGTTIEFYYKKIEKRKKYWKKYGDTALFEAEHENIFDGSYPENQYDIIIAQDTLHHLEPLSEAVKILKKTLKPEGKIIAIEENGNNLIQNLKLLKQRGFKTIVKIYDEKTGKNILLGNENIRSIERWKKIMKNAGLIFDKNSLEYIRYFLPHKAQHFTGFEELIKEERKMESKFIKKYFFFGINFCVKKKTN